MRSSRAAKVVSMPPKTVDFIRFQAHRALFALGASQSAEPIHYFDLFFFSH
jgi:hypothetical protein